MAMYMEIVMVVSIVCIVFIFFGYTYFRYKRQIKVLENKLITTIYELEEIYQSKQNMQDELTALKNKLQNAIEDPITKLLGSQLFEDRVQQSIHESARYQFTMGIMFIDIDNFKAINEALGYKMGDALLLEVSKRLRMCIRQVDSISRFTKDTFVVLLTQLGKPETAAIVAQRMLQSLAEPIEINNHFFYITACIGIAIYPTDGQDTTSLFRNADAALHIAKEKGSHVYQYYQEKVHSNSVRDLAISSALKRDLITQEFEIYYQPILNVANTNVFCLETLLHWRHPDFGSITANELSNFVDKYGKANIITEWLLKNACKQFINWRNLGFQPAYLGMAFSIKQLKNSNFIYRISQTLQELQFNPEWLLVILQDNSKQPISFEALEKSFNMLKYLNIKLAIDNFGANTFSLCDLKQFPINYLKLDALLIKDIQYNPKSAELIRVILSLAESLSIQPIIQGVESEQQMIKLKELGYTLMQGQFIAAPLQEKDLTSLWSSSLR